MHECPRKTKRRKGFRFPLKLSFLREYAQAHQFSVLHRYQDVETAKKRGRSDFGRMMRDLKRKPMQSRVILVEKTDRLYRNMPDWVTLAELGAEIHFVKEHTVISPTSNSSEKFTHGIKVLMAKQFIDNLSEETQKGMKEKAEQGLWPSRAPLGYRNVPGPKGKSVIEVDPEVGPIIRHIFEEYATGDRSLKEAGTVAKELGLVSRITKKPVPASTVHKLLKNLIYTGDFEWGGRVYQGTHQALISRELWEQVQQVLRKRHHNRHRKVRHDFTFARLLTCGHCGCSLVGEIKKGRYIYYHCTGYKGKCPEPFVREEILEANFASLLKKLRFDGEVLRCVSQALRESHVDEKKSLTEAITRLQAEYAKIQNRIDAMYTDKLDGKIDQGFFEAKSAEWRLEQTRLLRSIESHQRASQSYLDGGGKPSRTGSRRPWTVPQAGFS